MRSIPVQELSEPRADRILIDVRTPAEFEEMHIEGARHEPLNELDASVLADEIKGHEVCVICFSGTRAKQAAKKLVEAGCENTVILDGGVDAWEKAGMPLKRGRRTMSLERQVRIAAGSLVVLGVILGWKVAPAFFGLSAFVGAGLVFAGITDTCGMGMLIAKMPWNKRKSS